MYRFVLPFSFFLSHRFPQSVPFSTFRFLLFSEVKRKSAGYSHLIRFIYVQRVRYACSPWQFFFHFSFPLSPIYLLLIFLFIIIIIHVIYQMSRVINTSQKTGNEGTSGAFQVTKIPTSMDIPGQIRLD